MGLIQRVFLNADNHTASLLAEQLAQANAENARLKQEVKRLSTAAASLQSKVQVEKCRIANIESAMVKKRDRKIQQLTSHIQRMGENAQRTKSRLIAQLNREESLLDRLRSMVGEEAFLEAAKLNEQEKGQ